MGYTHISLLKKAENSVRYFSSKLDMYLKITARNSLTGKYFLKKLVG